MPRAGPSAVRKNSDELNLTAVRLSQQPGLQVKTVAAALTIHPFMLSKWRKDARDGRLRGRAGKAPPPGPAREIAQLQALENAHALLQEDMRARSTGRGAPRNWLELPRLRLRTSHAAFLVRHLRRASQKKERSLIPARLPSVLFLNRSREVSRRTV